MLVEAMSKLSRTPITSSEYESGVDAQFLRINDTWGVKLFKSEKIRDESHAYQGVAARAGVAPKVGEKFEINTPDENTYYGLLTECITETYGDRMSKEMFGRKVFDCEIIDMNEIEEIMYEDEKYIELIDHLNDIHIKTDDMHLLNVGYMPDGRLVAIDFSRC